MKELEHVGSADQEKVSAVERVFHAFFAALTPRDGGDNSPLADGVDEWGGGWLSDDVARVWAIRGDERLEAVVCPSTYEGLAAEIAISISSSECSMELDSWTLAALVAELRRQGLEGDIGYADCMKGALAVVLPEEVDS